MYAAVRPCRSIALGVQPRLASTDLIFCHSASVRLAVAPTSDLSQCEGLVQSIWPRNASIRGPADLPGRRFARYLFAGDLLVYRWYAS